MGKDCKYCGAYISDMVDICPSCGRKVRAEKNDAETAGSGAAAAAAANQAYTYKEEYERRYGENAQKSSAKASTQTNHNRSEDDDVRRNRGISFLCYFGILFLIPYLTRKDSDFVKFHSNQGLLLCLMSFLTELLGAVPLLGGLISFAGSLCVFVGIVLGLVNVYRGEKKPLPFIGEIQILK